MKRKIAQNIIIFLSIMMIAITTVAVFASLLPLIILYKVFDDPFTPYDWAMGAEKVTTTSKFLDRVFPLL
tara:strand:+ start:449 stop:658 length:210 start_codon:yes stop_codon:yes gene_type:complete